VRRRCSSSAYLQQPGREQVQSDQLPRDEGEERLRRVLACAADGPAVHLRTRVTYEDCADCRMFAGSGPAYQCQPL
jgi:hypothetical protein